MHRTGSHGSKAFFDTLGILFFISFSIGNTNDKSNALKTSTPKIDPLTAPFLEFNEELWSRRRINRNKTELVPFKCVWSISVVVDVEESKANKRGSNLTKTIKKALPDIQKWNLLFTVS